MSQECQDHFGDRRPGIGFGNRGSNVVALRLEGVDGLAAIQPGNEFAIPSARFLGTEWPEIVVMPGDSHAGLSRRLMQKQ